MKLSPNAREDLRELVQLLERYAQARRQDEYLRAQTPMDRGAIDRNDRKLLVLPSQVRGLSRELAPVAAARGVKLIPLDAGADAERVETIHEATRAARSLLGKLNHRLRPKPKRKRNRRPLTPRETEVYELVTKLGNYTKAARQMGVTRQTLTEIYESALRKLGFPSPMRLELSRLRAIPECGVSMSDDGKPQGRKSNYRRVKAKF